MIVLDLASGQARSVWRYACCSSRGVLCVLSRRTMFNLQHMPDAVLSKILSLTDFDGDGTV